MERSIKFVRDSIETAEEDGDIEIVNEGVEDLLENYPQDPPLVPTTTF